MPSAIGDRDSTVKPCSTCKLTKPVDEFHVDNRTSTGRSTSCMKCTSERSKRDYQKTPEAQKARLRESHQKRKQSNKPREYYIRKMGLTLDFYYAALTAQQGVCKICKSPPGTKDLAVDHDRRCCPQGRVCESCFRGLLCAPCNLSLGTMHDDVDRLRSAIRYLEDYEMRRSQCEPL